MAWDAWLKLWVVSTIPIIFYLLTGWYAYRLHHQPQMQADVRWHWSFLWLKLVVVGTTLIRVRALAQLWRAGRAGAWDVIDPELLVAAWCIGLGLFVHVYLLEQHPVWQTGGPRLLRKDE